MVQNTTGACLSDIAEECLVSCGVHDPSYSTLKGKSQDQGSSLWALQGLGGSLLASLMRGWSLAQTGRLPV